MKVRILNSAVGVPGAVVEMADGEARERIASGEVEPVAAAVEPEPKPRRRRTAAVSVPEVR